MTGSEEVNKVDFVDLDMVVGGTPSVKNEASEAKPGLSSGRRAVRKDRRKNKQDRRKSVREGIFVSLSVEDDRRILRDRRRRPA